MVNVCLTQNVNCKRQNIDVVRTYVLRTKVIGRYVIVAVVRVSIIFFYDMKKAYLERKPTFNQGCRCQISVFVELLARAKFSFKVAHIRSLTMYNL